MPVSNRNEEITKLIYEPNDLVSWKQVANSKENIKHESILARSKRLFKLTNVLFSDCFFWESTIEAFVFVAVCS